LELSTSESSRWMVIPRTRPIQTKFLKKFPSRFTECFIAEQNMVGVATGFATRGKVPFASTFATFFSRAFDQVRVAGISRSNIKLVGRMSA